MAATALILLSPTRLRDRAATLAPDDAPAPILHHLPALKEQLVAHTHAATEFCCARLQAASGALLNVRYVQVFKSNVRAAPQAPWRPSSPGAPGATPLWRVLA